jgi:hypothetical protein
VTIKPIPLRYPLSITTFNPSGTSPRKRVNPIVDLNV